MDRETIYQGSLAGLTIPNIPPDKLKYQKPKCICQAKSAVQYYKRNNSILFAFLSLVPHSLLANLIQLKRKDGITTVYLGDTRRKPRKVSLKSGGFGRQTATHP